MGFLASESAAWVLSVIFYRDMLQILTVAMVLKLIAIQGFPQGVEFFEKYASMIMSRFERNDAGS